MKTKEEIRIRKHEYYLKNKEKFLSSNKKRRELNREAMLEYSKQYYADNKEKWKEYNDTSASGEKREKRLNCIRKLKKSYGQTHKRESLYLEREVNANYVVLLTMGKMDVYLISIM